MGADNFSGGSLVCTVTLYRKRYDPVVREDVWSHTQYMRAHWYGGDGLKLLNNRYASDDSYIARIFTQDTIEVHLGDILALGKHEAQAPPCLSEQVRRFTVTSVVDNRRGSPRVQHWKIGGI